VKVGSIDQNSIKENEMKKFKAISLAVVIAAALLLSMVMVASAQTARTNLTSFEYDCLVDPGTMWMEGDILHIRGRVHVNVTVSDTPEFNGINTTIADADINVKTGYAEIRGTLSFQPDGIAGTWEGSWTWNGNKGVGYGRTVAHGIGALSGKSLFLKMYDAPYDPQATADMCDGIGEPDGNVYAEGYILDPAGP
jgi:hypothetical protein